MLTWLDKADALITGARNSCGAARPTLHHILGSNPRLSTRGRMGKGRHAVDPLSSSKSATAYVQKPREWAYKTVMMTNNEARLHILTRPLQS